MRTPNPEQRKAIEHNGGVVLRAGAGSGKTFVLVEHFVYLMEQYKTRVRATNQIELRAELKKYMSSLVFMTFTKKAAAELEIRLQSRVDAQREVSEDHYWQSVKEELSALTISTIHGYCFKLISQGFFPTIDPKVTIISEKAQSDRIAELTDEWLTSNADLERDVRKQILLSQKSLVQSMHRIFSDPETRLLWTKEQSGSSELSFAEFYRELASELSCENILQPITLPDGGKKPAAYLSVLASYNEMLTLGDELSPSDFQKVFEKARLTPPKNHPEVAEYIKSLKPIRDALKTKMSSLIAYYEGERESCHTWKSALFSLFNYIEANYLNIRGITFSDLEYYVLKGLESEEVCELIATNYNYFVVDEFQDTSEIQYQILDKLIRSDSSRIFCVGDLKQAIYGFRGGDIGVFRKTMERVPLNLDLKLNYRSSRSVIEFNNSLFATIMPKGVGFKDIDKHAVEFESQEVPDICTEQGLIQKLHIDLVAPSEEEKKKWPSNSELNRFEAQAIASEIESILQENPEDDIAILYSKLSPSFDLIGLLMKMDCSFSAQVKILSSEDPVLSMCSLLAQCEDKNQYAPVVLLLNSYLTILEVHKRVSKEEIEIYQSERSLWGELEALLRFFWRLGFSNSNYSETFERLRDLSQQAGGGRPEFIQKLAEGRDERYSIEFQYSGRVSHIQIMTAHASKGLEFKHVFLGGIYTNGRKMPSLERVGLDPGSFKWSPKGIKGESYTTPQFILEQRREVLKNFSEAKRLFYVACTRAQKALYWVELMSEGNEVRCESDSWILALREWESERERSGLVSTKKIETREKSSSVSHIPFFHFDGLGVYEKETPAPALVTLTDLSVTRLATLAICPRKFYLKNILKFDDLEDLIFEDESDYRERQLEGQDQSESELPFSSVSVDERIQRGLRLHDAIHRMIVAGNVIPLKSEASDLSILENVKKRIGQRVLKGCQLFSETQLKFDFFGHMISGIPDFFAIHPQGEILEVWDFKTGRAAAEKDLIYWFQVACYGHALARKYGIKSIKLALYYIDSDDFKEVEITPEQNDLFLAQTWKRIYKLDQVNKDHCSSCEFGKLCQGQGECVAPVKLSDMI